MNQPAGQYQWAPTPTPPRRSNAGGCFLGLAAVGGVVVLIGASLAFQMSRPNPGDARAYDGGPTLDEQIAASAAAATAKYQADLELSFRKQCKRLDGGLIFPLNDEDLRDLCHAQVRESLKVPGSAEFPSGEDRIRLMTADGCKRTFTSTFVAKNAFGVMVKTGYDCTYDPKTGQVALKVTE